MNILQIAPQVPYPLNDGGKVGIYNITKHLSLRGHNVTLLCFDRGKNSDISELQKFCTVVTVQHSTNNSAIGALLNIFSNVPYNISKYFSKEFETQLRQLLSQKKFDIVHVDHLHMAHYGVICKKEYGLPIVLREHNIESTILERYRQTVEIPILKQYLDIQLKRLNIYEAQYTREFNYCAVITPEDLRRLKILQPSASTYVVPAGVSNEYFEDIVVIKEPYTISFFGGFDWIPNQDALYWFIQEIFPAVQKKYPQTKLVVIGKNVPTKLKKFESSTILFKGFVENLRSEVKKTQLTIAPYRIGGGMRLKILESFAMKVPVVATAIGCEGIECTHGQNILIGDTPEEFAQLVINLFEDATLHRTITDNAYTLAKRLYTWESIVESLESVYLRAIRSNV